MSGVKNSSRKHPTITMQRPPESARRVAALVPEAAEKDWFRIENKAEESDSADIYIYDEIGYWGTSASNFIRQVENLEVSTIVLHLNSPGGEVFDGTAIYNTLVQHPAFVSVVVDGLAASAASFIAQAGDEIIMGQGAMMMIHDASGMAWGNAAEMHSLADVLDKISNNIASIYAANAGGTTEEWRELMKAEVWYSAEEAVAAKLATKVGTKVTKSPENQWNLSVFNHAGRSQAPDPQQVRLSAAARVKESKMANPTPVRVAVGAPATGNRVQNEVEAEPVVEGTEATTPPEPVFESQGADEPDDEVEVEETQSVEAEPNPPVQGEPEPVTNKAGAIGVIINGKMVTDSAAIQAHIAGLEGFQTEIRSAERKSFIDGLERDGKIVAASRPATEALVASFTDEQFSNYRDSMESAPQMPLFGRHVGPRNSDGVPSTNADRIVTLQETIKHLRNAGKKDSFIHDTETYKELQSLLSQEA